MRLDTNYSRLRFLLRFLCTSEDISRSWRSMVQSPCQGSMISCTGLGATLQRSQTCLGTLLSTTCDVRCGTCLSMYRPSMLRVDTSVKCKCIKLTMMIQKTEKFRRRDTGCFLPCYFYRRRIQSGRLVSGISCNSMLEVEWPAWNSNRLSFCRSGQIQQHLLMGSAQRLHEIRLTKQQGKWWFQTLKWSSIFSDHICQQKAILTIELMTFRQEVIKERAIAVLFEANLASCTIVGL